MSAAARASFSRMRPNSLIDFPNCLRSSAYCAPARSAHFIPPTANAPSLSRPTLRMLKAILWPLPISPRTFSTGTLQSSKMSGVVELPRRPSLCSSRPWVKPGMPRSTIIAVNFVPSILRKTM